MRKQKAYLFTLFDIDQETGHKMDPEVVAREIRRAKDLNGERSFAVRRNVFPLSRFRYSSQDCLKQTLLMSWGLVLF